MWGYYFSVIIKMVYIKDFERFKGEIVKIDFI